MSFSEKLRIIRAKQNFSFFNNLFEYPPPQYNPAPMHKEWEDILQSAYGKYHKILLLASRGAAKSERVTINYPSWMIGKHPNLRITIVSTPEKKACSFLSKITARIEEDEVYRSIFGNLKPVNPRVWRNDAITIKRRIVSKDPSICAVGTMGQAVSKRADVVIVDDPLDSENTKSEFQRENLINWFHDALDPILEPSGLMVVILTPWHESDLSQYLMKQSGWRVLKYPAIMNPEENLDLWLETDDPSLTVWPEKYGYMIDEIDHNGNPILDEDGNIKRISFLRSKYNANLDSFSSQYLLDPFSVTGTLFNVEWLKFFSMAEWELVKPQCLIYQGWDLAISLKERADYTVCVTVAHYASLNQIYVLEVYRDKLTPLQQFDAVVNQYLRWNPICPVRQITVESDQYQTALSMGLIERTSLPVVESGSKGRSKLDRIGLLGPHFQNGRIRLIEGLRGGEFVYEFKRFPKGAKDDQLDALHKCVEPILGRSGSGELFIGEIDVGDRNTYI